ncbi:MAG: Cys-tRNA(Pro) deacylase, partial [Oscillospiraceae bacterium]|nr:Cys-tRNA(Pro) deacylase [Oscillospiraceae bacterium]
MKSEKIVKTNVMRILDQKKIAYQSYCYADTQAVSGVEVAQVLKQNPAQVFKTLVTVSGSGEHFVIENRVGKQM